MTSLIVFPAVSKRDQCEKVPNSKTTLFIFEKSEVSDINFEFHIVEKRSRAG